MTVTKSRLGSLLRHPFGMPIYLALSILLAQSVLFSAIGWVISGVLITALVIAWSWRNIAFTVVVALTIVSTVLWALQQDILSVLHSVVWYLSIVALISIGVRWRWGLGAALQIVCLALFVLSLIATQYGLFERDIWHETIWKESSVSVSIKVLTQQGHSLMPFEALADILAANWLVLYFAVGLIGWWIGCWWFRRYSALGTPKLRLAVRVKLMTLFFSKAFVVSVLLLGMACLVLREKLTITWWNALTSICHVGVVALCLQGLTMLYCLLKRKRYGGWGLTAIYAALMVYPSISWVTVAGLAGLDTWYDFANRKKYIEKLG